MGAITVGQLIELLKVEDPARLVVLSSDAEGNKHSPLASLWSGAYEVENTWRGEVGLEKLTPEDRKNGYEEEDVLENGDPALILGPIN